MTFYLIWALLLVAQNASHTLTIRARAGKSLWYNGVASVGSNGVWFVSQVLVIDQVTTALRSNDVASLVWTGLFYITFTIMGSVGAHWAAMKWERA